MSVHGVKKVEKKLDNEIVFDCSKEELKEIIKKFGIDEDQAFNFNMMVALPPKREKSIGGIIILEENSETEQFRTSIGRILSLGSTVGQGELLKDCRNLEVGDYVKYAFYAAGNPENYKGIAIKFLADDQIKGKITNPNDIDKLYDYKR